MKLYSYRWRRKKADSTCSPCPSNSLQFQGLSDRNTSRPYGVLSKRAIGNMIAKVVLQVHAVVNRVGRGGTHVVRHSL